ncbi:MAG: glycosyltransferase family 4 protein [Clostridiaceae bacterium]|nr:glycosyltransferase family 4 protein [Clostridiaceae bacterium]
MPTVNMLSSANKIKGQGVSSAYIEQVNLVKNGLKNNYEIKINKIEFCDIMHYHTIDLKFFLSVKFSKLSGTSVAYVHFVPETIEDSLKLPKIVKKIFYKYIIRFYKSVDHLVVVNPYFVEILKTYGLDENKITYIPNFVSEENFYRISKIEINKLKQRYNISPEKFVVLGVGQVQSRKGVIDFIEVAKKLPHIQFLWAGGFSFGCITEGYSELKKIMEDPPINVKFLGIINREEMNEIYNLADLMFLPSFSELFPMSVLEAMSLKLPILLRELEIYHSILFEFYLKGKGIEEFVSIINSIKSNKEDYKVWSENSWRCHQYYSRESVLEMWKVFYDEIYEQKNKLNLRSPLNEK